MRYELVHSECDDEGISYTLEIAQETETPNWDLTQKQLKRLLKDIECGNLIYFIAKCTAWKSDKKLGEDYLSGCCYKSIDEFLKDGYWQDMKNQAKNVI